MMIKHIKKNIFSKKMIYMLCFIALNFLDVMRDFQFEFFQIQHRVYGFKHILPGYRLGDIWLIVANCSGIFMAIIVFSAYSFRKFVNVLNGIWVGICLSAMVILPFVRTGKYGTIMIQEELALFNICWIGILVIYYIKAIVKKEIEIHIDKVGAVWILLMLCMVVSMARAKVWPLWYLFMFGVFYLTKYKKEDYNDLFDALLDGSIIAFLIMQLGAFFMRPFNDMRYQGIHTNWNISALYYVIILIMCLCKLHVLQMQGDKKKIKKVYYLIVAGVSLSLQFMTGCRTAWITTVLLVVIYGLIVVRKIWKMSWKQVFFSGVVLVATMLLTFVPVFSMARWMPTILPVRMWSVGEYNVAVNLEGDLFKDDNYTEMAVFLDYTVGRIWNTFFPKKEEAVSLSNTDSTDVKTESINVETTGHKDIDKITNAKIPSWIKDPAMQQRFRVYSAYLHDMTWLGNGPESDLARNAYHAHNLWIQIGYFYGIPAGILLIILSIMLVVRGFWQVKSKLENPYVIVTLLITVLFFVYGLTEVVWNPGQLILFLVFFLQYPHGKQDVLAE